MKRLIPYFLFYKNYALWSIGVTTILVVLGVKFIIVASTKLILLIFLWHFLELVSGLKVIDYVVKQKLPARQFFIVIYIMDLVASIPFVLIFQEFI